MKMLPPRFLLTASALLFASGMAVAEPSARTWSDTAGHTFEGTFLSTSSGKVSIRRTDGVVFEVDLTRLSKADADYVHTTAAATAVQAVTETRFTGTMLDGYDGSSPNFSAPWPKEAGIDKEPEITTVEENPGEKRFVYESPHFHFQSNVLLRPSLVSKVAMMFEATFQVHHDIPLNNRRTRSPKAGKLKAFLYETMAEYHAAGGPASSAGVYMSQGDKFLVPLEGLGVKKVGSGYMFDYNGDFHTVYHELTHQLWADIGDSAGIWIVEGFAEFMACAPYSNGKFSFIKQPAALMEYATGYGKKDKGGRALGKDFTMPHLEQLLNWTQAKFYSANGNANYGYGTLLAYYFVLLDGDGSHFKDCIKASQQGKSREEALKVLMGDRSYDTLEKDIAAAFQKKGVRIAFK